MACGRRYRLDFVVILSGYDINHEIESLGLRWVPFAIEVDGHGFHEKTPDQVAYRNQRDRDLMESGWTVFHFSWSEMTERPEVCVTEVVEAANRRYWQLLRSVSEKRQSADRSAEN